MKRKRIPRPARCPTMVAMFVAPEAEIMERLSINAISQGWAETQHFNVLGDCHDLLALAATEKRDEQTLAVCNLAGIALLNIKDRYLSKNRIGATGDELQALCMLVDVSTDWWRRKSGELYRRAHVELDRQRRWA